MKSNGVLSANLTYEREILFKKWKHRGDITEWNKNRISKNVHVNMFDKNTEKQAIINKLLSKYKNVCIILKNITLTLEFPWTYQHC